MKSSPFCILYIYVRFKKKDGTMGRITDGSFNTYGKGKEQIDVATQNRLANPNGKHTTLGILGAALLPNLLSGIACCAADASVNGGGGSSVPKTDTKATPESLKQEIDTKLAEVNCNDLDAVRTELSDKKAQIPALDKAVKDANEILTNLNNGVREAETELANSQSEIKALEQLKAENSPEFDSARYEYLTVTLPAQIEKAKNEQIPAAEKALTEAQDAQRPVATRITELESAVKYIEPRARQLQELELTNAVEQYNNKESKKILSLIKELNNETNENKRVQVARELRTAIENYYANHEVGECPTIDKLPAATNYLAVKNFKPDTSELDELVKQQFGFAPRKVS